jgi:hypothetical protein
VARDATARLYDVDVDSVVLDQKLGSIIFRAKKGRLIDLDQLHESIWATRLSGNTGMALGTLDVTAVGAAQLLGRDVLSKAGLDIFLGCAGKTAVTIEPQDVVLRVAGSDQLFGLALAPHVKLKPGDKDAFTLLKEALVRGERVVSVTGRLEGWRGHFPGFLSKPTKRPRVILVHEFQTAKP